MNGGDVLKISIYDPPDGLTAMITDLTTHRTGWMVASAANGFMNTNISTCDGTPFTFHAEYNTAKQQNQVPWAALEGGVIMEQEIGHSEACNSVANQDPYSANYPGGQSYSDPDTYDTCDGGSEGPNAIGEGPCNPLTFICQNSTTQGPTGPVACPTEDSNSGALCEFADGFCFPKADLRSRTTARASTPLPAAHRAAHRIPSSTVGTSYSNGRPRGWYPRAPSIYAVRHGGPTTLTPRVTRQSGHHIFREHRARAASVSYTPGRRSDASASRRRHLASACLTTARVIGRGLHHHNPARSGGGAHQGRLLGGEPCLQFAVDLPYWPRPREATP
jgi:hypothetical protein